MSKIETNTIAPSTGTTLTLGESGDTIAIGSGVGLSGLAVKKITVNEGITSQYSSLGAGDTTLTDIKVIHTALSTSNKLGFFISIPYSLYTGTYVGITNFKLNDLSLTKNLNSVYDLEEETLLKIIKLGQKNASNESIKTIFNRVLTTIES